MTNTEQIILKGIKGIAEGETFYINYGQVVSIGRSRTNEISLRHCKKYQALKPPDLKTDGILSISRKHLRISFYNWQCVELKDLSTNGTYIAVTPAEAGAEKKYERVSRRVITDIKEHPYEIRIGTNETFLLSAGPAAGASGDKIEIPNEPKPT